MASELLSLLLTGHLLRERLLLVSGAQQHVGAVLRVQLGLICLVVWCFVSLGFSLHDLFDVVVPG